MNSEKASASGRFIILILAVFTSYLIVLNFIQLFYTESFSYILLVVPALALVFLIAYKLDISPVSFAFAVFVIAFLIKGIFVSMVNTQPVSDFSVFYDSAVSLVKGDLSFSKSVYFRTWAYQTGPVLYYAAIMKLFGTGLLPLKLINCAFMAGSNVFVYLIARKVSNDFTARFVAIAYLIYPAPYFLAAVLTNQHFAACMFLAAIYILLCEKLNIAVRGIFAGLLISVGNAVRPLGVVIVIASIVWALVEALRNRQLLKPAMVGVLLAVYLLTNMGLSAGVKYSGINPDGLANNFPLWKFVVGLNQQSYGQFSYDDEKNIYYIGDRTKRDKAAMQAIKERLSVRPDKFIGFLGTKQYIMWAGFDTLAWEFNLDENGEYKYRQVKDMEPIILAIEKVFYLLVFILMLIGFCRALVFRKINTETMLISILLLCFFGVHLFIEVQVRYRYFAMLPVFIIAAKGSELLFSHLKNYNRRLIDNQDG